MMKFYACNEKMFYSEKFVTRDAKGRLFVV